jgi:hypothetical protein
LNRAELGPFDLPRDRAQLARWVDFGLDATAGILLDGSGEVPRVEIGRSVGGRRRDFHHVGVGLRLRSAEREHNR